ncbi:MAG: hypothetical protein ACHQIG_01545 [Acidimicrobiia bacterium]
MRKLLLALGATFLVLLGTGLYQAFRYVPSPASAWGARHATAVDRGLLYDATEVGHRWGAYAFCALAVAVIIVWILREQSSTRATLIAVVVLTVLALATIAQVITGRGIRWNQLALWAVTVGSGIKGVAGFDAKVKYVLIGGDELSWSEFSTRVFLHLVLFPVGLILVGGVLWFLSTRNARRRIAPHVRDTPDTDEMVEAAT